jgi:hypothetical protein
MGHRPMTPPVEMTNLLHRNCKVSIGYTPVHGSTGAENETFPAVERYPHPIAHLPVVESTTGVIIVAGLICDSKTFTA